MGRRKANTESGDMLGGTLDMMIFSHERAGSKRHTVCVSDLMGRIRLFPPEG